MNHKTTHFKSFILACVLLGAMSCRQSPQQASTSPSDQTDSTATASEPVSEETRKQIKANLSNSVLGIDVSHFQSDVNWEEVKQANIQYMYTKATQGTDDVDPKYKRNKAGATAAGLFHGSYHFYMAGDDPVKQAELYIKTVMPLSEKSIPPVLDLEQGGMKNGISVTAYQKNVLIWLTKVEAALGVRPIIYTDHPFGNQYLNHPDFAKYHLWIAEYGAPEPKIPDAWKSKGWLMWQRTERGKVEGAIGNVDHDLFNGTPQVLDDLVVN
jgi:lysozyme